MAENHLDYLPIFASPLADSEGPLGIPGKKENAGQSTSESPDYVRHKETTNSELFYDLFFVANLTVFGYVKNVNNGKTLSQYIGFFSVIWFTWYQVSMYDIRFAADSLFERISKLIQFGVMIGFAMCGPTFNPGDKKENANLSTFEFVTLILMASRLTLALQYIQTLWHLWYYQRTRLPMVLTIAIYLISATVYGALTNTFEDDHEYTFIVWYVGSVVETILCTSISSKWRVISFKGTHLVQRMSLLTLIILGEGVMELTFKCQEVFNIFNVDASTVGNIICGALIIYFLYFMYFDWLQKEHMGTIRQQIWSFFHFPFHLALALTLEGANQFIAWRAATVLFSEVSLGINSVYNELSNSSSSSDFQTASSILQSLSDQITEDASSSVDGSYGIELITSANITIYDSLAQLNTTDSLSDSVQPFNEILTTLGNVIYSMVGFVPTHLSQLPTNSFSDTTVGNVQEYIRASSIVSIAEKTLIYFFVCLGSVLILQCILGLLGKRKKTLTDRVRLGCTFVIGLTACLFCLIETDLNTGQARIYYRYITSPWVLPTAIFLLIIVVVLDNIRVPFASRSKS